MRPYVIYIIHNNITI